MRKIRTWINLLFTSLIILTITMNKSVEAQVAIGVFADCQYCDCETKGNRYYRNSIKKLTACIAEFNGQKDLDFVVGLGDLIDRDYQSFDKLKPVLETSKNKVYHVTGNHDYEVEKRFIEKVPESLNLDETYYSFHKKGWQFIFLNGNEITFQSNEPEIIEKAEKMVMDLKQKNNPNHHTWNGGISNTQLEWLDRQLKTAHKKNRKAVLFCHYPLLPLEAHTLWNSDEVLTLINKYNCVKAWINGHNHNGNYVAENGIHYITLMGMVDTEYENAFATMRFNRKNIEIKGYGREESRSLIVRD